MTKFNYNNSIGLDTIIPTTKGYKTMETIEVGDEVFGFNNKPVKVVEVFAINNPNNITTPNLLLSIYKVQIVNISINKDINIAFIIKKLNKTSPSKLP